MEKTEARIQNLNSTQKILSHTKTQRTQRKNYKNSVVKYSGVELCVALCPLWLNFFGWGVGG